MPTVKLRTSCILACCVDKYGIELPLKKIHGDFGECRLFQKITSDKSIPLPGRDTIDGIIGDHKVGVLRVGGKFECKIRPGPHRPSPNIKHPIPFTKNPKLMMRFKKGQCRRILKLLIILHSSQNNTYWRRIRSISCS